MNHPRQSILTNIFARSVTVQLDQNRIVAAITSTVMADELHVQGQAWERASAGRSDAIRMILSYPSVVLARETFRHVVQRENVSDQEVVYLAHVTAQIQLSDEQILHTVVVDILASQRR